MVAGWYLLACQSKFASMLKFDQSSWKRFSQLFRNLVQVFIYLVLKWTNQILYSIWHSGGGERDTVLSASLYSSKLSSHYLFYSCFWKLWWFKVFRTKTFYSFTHIKLLTNKRTRTGNLQSRVHSWLFKQNNDISRQTHTIFIILHISTKYYYI